MRSKAKTNSDMGKLVLEGMMTVFIVLIFLFIAQNWVLTNADDTMFTPTCSLPGAKVGTVPFETNNIMDDYTLCKIRFDNM